MSSDRFEDGNAPAHEDRLRRRMGRAAAHHITSAGTRLTQMAPNTILALLAASACTELVFSDTPEAVGQATTGLLAGMGGNYLAAITERTAARLRRQRRLDGPALTAALAQAIERDLRSPAMGENVSTELAAVLRQLDLAQETLTGLVAAGSARVTEETLAAFDTIRTEHAEFGFLLTELTQASARATAELTHLRQAQDDQRRELERDESERWTQARLLGQVHDLVAGMAAEQPEPRAVTGAGQAPYLGPRTFTEADEVLFHGREPVVAALAERLGDQGILVVTGPSKSGKTSLLRAGLLPSLSASWHTASAAPLDELALAIARLNGERDAVTIRAELAAHPEGAPLLIPPGTAPVLVADQVEQVLDAEAPLRDAYCSALTALSERAMVIVCVRQDALDRLGLDTAEQFAVPPMTESELARAIHAPAAAYGSTVQPGLTDLVLRDLRSGGGYGPLAPAWLSRAMLSTWQAGLNIRAYGGSGGVPALIAAAAEALYTSLDPESQEAAAALFSREDLTPATPREQAVLEAYAEAAVVVLGGGANPELAHDSLPETWPRLREWRTPRIVRLAPVPPRRRPWLAAAAVAAAAVLTASVVLFSTDSYRQVADLAQRVEGVFPGNPALARLLAVAAHRQAPDSPEATATLKSMLMNPLLTVLPGQGSPLAFTRDGRTLAIGDDKGRVQRRRFPTGEILGPPLAGPLGEGTLLAFSPDGTRLALSVRTDDDQPADLRVWDLATGRPVTPRLTGIDVPTWLAFDSGGSVLTASDHLARRYSWRVPAGTRLPGGPGGLKATNLYGELDPTGIHFAAFNRKGPEAWLWTNGGEPVSITRDLPIEAVEFSRDGRLLAAAEADRVEVLSIGTPVSPVGQMGAFPVDLNPDINNPDAAKPMAFSPDGTILAVGGEDQVRLLDLRVSRFATSAFTLLTPGGGDITTLAFAPDGQTLATADTSGDVRVWSMARLMPDLSVGLSDVVPSVALSPDGSTIATSEDSLDFPQVLLWDATTGEQRGAAFAGRAAVTFLSDQALLTDAGDAPVQWDIVTHAAVRRFEGDFSASDPLIVSPNGHLLATSDENGLAQLWDMGTGRRLGGPLPAKDRIGGLSFSPDSRLLATGGDRLRLWDTATRTALPLSFFLEGLPAVGHHVTFSPDGRLLASAEDDGIQLWDSATGAPYGVPMSSRNSIAGLSFTPDGGTLISIGGNATRLWDVATQRPLGDPLTAHNSALTDLAVSRDGRTFVTGATDFSASVWRLPDLSGDLAREVCAMAGRDLTAAEWATHLPDTAYRRVC
ncbi:nSTAND1 domain-containing NTPase [Sphaerisporangium perillae]|uniref:nSTAND1 domain-containing NTPase n=1 Tax=Sphaerisporangium perillae TaxID=2935860 RepID=UPI00200EC254|nr:hypothetical protein [Sphaerisporangium perillae]